MDKTAPVREPGTPVPTLEEEYTNQKKKGIKKIMAAHNND